MNEADVTVVTNTAASHADKADPAGVAAEEKTQKHAGNVAAAGPYDFFPLAFESSGTVHPLFDKLVEVLGRNLEFGDRKEFQRNMCFSVTTALQRGNARILKHTYARIGASKRFGSRLWA